MNFVNALGPGLFREDYVALDPQGEDSPSRTARCGVVSEESQEGTSMPFALLPWASV